MQDQLQSWNIPTFNLQKMDIDECIDLINTLCDMLGQTEESKMEKFIDTMPTKKQTHMITEKTWQETTDKVKELEHIIRKCDPLAAALPNLAKGTTVPSLYSHIAHSDDKEETDIPQPFKGACPKQSKQRGIGKGKQPQQYIEAKIQVDSLEATICVAEVNEIRTHTRANIKTIAIRATITRVIEDSIITHTGIFLRVISTANLEVEAMAKAEAIIAAMVMVGPIPTYVTYVKPLNRTLPLRPVEIEFENNRCCLEVCNTLDCTIEFQYGQKITYFDARSKGLVQINNLKHFPIDQYLHDRVTPANR